MKTKGFIVFIISIFILTIACNKDSQGIDIEYKYYEDYDVITETLNLPSYPLSYDITFPKYYIRRTSDFDKDLATLGRVLFYDKNLSKDGKISCASCHKQELGFADDLPFSKGVSDRETKRNSLALGSVFNFREYYGSIENGQIPFFWDNRVTTVQEQSQETFANSDEMDMKMHEVADAVRKLDYYRPLYKAAFGKSDFIEQENILNALDEFVSSISSTSSKFDKSMDDFLALNETYIGFEEKDFPTFTAMENRGKAIYMQNCASCHGAASGAPGKVFANNGLDKVYSDAGMADVFDQYNNGDFKVPTLRNIALTAPYMHDGRFASLEEVLDHYSEGIQDHEHLDIALKKVDGAPKQFKFTEDEKAALLEFFETLTDETFINEERFSDPFKG